MSPELHEWTHLLLRWVHVVAGILWIGQTAFFSWLDARMTREAGEGGEEVWMVHSGGFYRVEKLGRTDRWPAILHWFRWEAATSWLSGLALMALLYWFGGLMVDRGSPWSAGTASALGVGVLILGWVVYDLLWSRAFVGRETLGTWISLALVALVAYGLTRVMSGRAAYLHLGALFGTVMAANVWMRILPPQRRMVAALRAGEEPDPALGDGAKARSTHNTFLAVPLVFIMISSHFPTTSYGHRLNWLMLLVFVAGGFAARSAMNAWNRR